MEFTAKHIAVFLNGVIEGNPEVKVNSISKIEEGKPGTITFLSNPLYKQYIYKTQASIVLVNRDFIAESPINATLIRVENSYSSLAQLLDLYLKNIDDELIAKSISGKSHILENVKIGDNPYIGEFVYIGKNSLIGNNVRIYPQVFIGDNVKIGNNTTIYPGVKIYSDNIIGNKCIIHSGVIIGGDGFGFAQNKECQYIKIAQIGNVVIEDEVEIGSNTTLDRATIGSTRIRKGVKLDNQIQIAHNVEIGENTVIAAQTGISGSTKIGKNCMIGGQVGIVGHLIIGDNVRIAAQSGVMSDIGDNETIQGSPSFDVIKYKKSYVHFRNFHDIVKKIDLIEKEINIIKEKK